MTADKPKSDNSHFQSAQAILSGFCSSGACYLTPIAVTLLLSCRTCYAAGIVSLIDFMKGRVMGFGSFLMSMAKNMSSDVLDSSKDMQKYISEYRSYSVPALKKEYLRLKKSAATTEITNRKMAVANLIQKQQAAERLKKKQCL